MRIVRITLNAEQQPLQDQERETKVSKAMANHDQAFPLTMASEGDRVQIFLLCGGDGLAMRLTTLGLNLGSELTVSQRQGGGLVVIRGETRLALGTGMAQKILVTRQDN